MVRIVLIDDHTIVRQGVKLLLEKEAEFEIVGEAASGEEGVRQVKELLPDVLVTDLRMAGMSGIEVTRQVSASFPGIAVIVLSMYGASGYVAEALKAGAKGYILKGSDSNELVQAVHECAAGHRYLSPAISEKGIEEYLEKSKPSAILARRK